MEKIYCIQKSLYSSSEHALKDILAHDYQITNAAILRNENGKPYLKNGASKKIFFSITHTFDYIFIAFSKENIGIDAEPLSRQVHYSSIIKKFPFEEQTEILSTLDFLRHWTAKESTIKWLGGSIAKDLKNLSYLKKCIQYKGLSLPIKIIFLEYNHNLLALSTSNVDLQPQFIHLTDRYLL